ncbi:hypothetical protein K8B33_07760 [Alcanivorax sp. JB21]|uniref:hypothetical protein n=1 Tax=Alcanivorax limicola TaxID=2874102 RepID=UPI001CBDF954|nr:hypothetical protein [Alcanivorax limicola]MBZ2188988.1 hypothetical protein [Alcanivorax limicola]
MFRIRALTPLLISSALLVACGGGGGSGGGGERTGVFKDSNVIGIDYRTSSGMTGTTNERGEFRYRKNDVVTFRVGNVEIGSAPGAAVVLPVDMVEAGISIEPGVTGRVRFMLMLDEDGDPDNGISISEEVRTLAMDWTQPEFASGNLAGDIADIISDVASVHPGASLPSAAVAIDHLQGTIRCVRAGAYQGTYQGSDRGTFGFLVDALSGGVSGVAFSDIDGGEYILSAFNNIEYSQESAFVSRTSSDVFFNGRFPDANSVSGGWAADGSTGGSFSGRRIGGLSNADFRFTGAFTGDDEGLFSFDVSESGMVQGVGYSILEDELVTLSGSVTGTTLSATYSEGNISGTLNRDTGALNGTWQNTVFGISGTFSGSGCRLN